MCEMFLGEMIQFQVKMHEMFLVKKGQLQVKGRKKRSQQDLFFNHFIHIYMHAVDSHGQPTQFNSIL